MTVHHAPSVGFEAEPANGDGDGSKDNSRFSNRGASSNSVPMIGYFAWAAACVVGLLIIIAAVGVAAFLRRRGRRSGARRALSITIVVWPIVILGGGLAFGGGLPLLAASVIALLAVRDAVMDARSLRASTVAADARSPLSGAVYAIAEIHLLINRPGPAGLVISMLLAVGLAAAARRAPLLRPSSTSAGRRVRVVAAVVVAVGTVALFGLWQGRSSVLPQTYSLMAAGHPGSGTERLADAVRARYGTATPGHPMPMGAGTAGAGSATAQPTNSSGMVSVADLGAGLVTGPTKRLTVTAEAAGDRWVFEPRELRVHRGDRVEVTVTNRLPEATSVHWHGVNVPGKEDGVPGLTQDAIEPGASRLYAFDANDVGTYWFHSHQNGLEQIAKGMFGALVVLPDGGVPQRVDTVVALHTWPDATDVSLTSLAGSTALLVPSATAVRLRVVNTDDLPHRVDLRGAAFQVSALDGHDLSGPTSITETAIDVPAGGRVDLTYEQPATPVALRSGAAAFVIGAGGGDVTGGMSTAVFDPMTYGEATQDTVTRGDVPDVSFQVVAENRLGWYDGAFGARVALNGKLYPDGEMLMVRPGQLAQVTVINRSFVSHPMHLHGHFFSVLARNGQPRSGTPLRLDSIEVAPGESVVLAFRADNPGLWMFHCHNGFHAAAGMDLMVGYEGVMTPYRAGVATGNSPQ